MKVFSNRFYLVLIFSLSGLLAYTQNHQDIIQNILNKKANSFNLSIKDVQNWKITDFHQDRKSGIWHYYLTQEYNGLLLYNSIATVAIKDQKAFLSNSRFIPNLSQKVQTTSATITAKEAILSGAKSLGLIISGEIIQKDKKGEKHYIFNAEEISNEEINVRLKLFQIDKETIRSVWDLDIYELNKEHWWSIRVDAQTGELLDKTDWVLRCFSNKLQRDISNSTNYRKGINHEEKTPIHTSRQGARYNVFAIPVESPNFGSRSIVVAPEDPVASPYGWHDTDGISGPEFTSTLGNNVYASEDWDDLDGLGYLPNGGPNLDFDFPLNLDQDPIHNIDAAITNLFYTNNIMHDVWYHYGFDEASGNFQKNNYGNGGLGDDQVKAQAQDGGGMNNANMTVPPDGYNPRMQMYLWRPYMPYLLTVNNPSAISGSYFSQHALFGPILTENPITSDIVMYNDNVMDPMDACESAINGAALAGKIALISRGDCDYTLQVQNAEAAGAIAVIVMDQAGGFSVRMTGSAPGIGIPAVMVPHNVGLDIVAQIQNNTNVNATLKAPPGYYDLDGDFDNGIIAHEYGHGISIRLAGGASTSGCLNNNEQMGEGWSDWFALMLTMRPEDQATDGRGIATYAFDQDATGGGLRPQKYSTDFNINDATYGITNDTLTLFKPHGIGFVWATMLWDMTWKLIDKYGFDPDLYYGTGGNNIAMHLVIEGIKLQFCSPGFVDARNAILLADELLYNGENQCLIWEAFANRGLGYSADQGDYDSRIDQTEAFDLPPDIDINTHIDIDADNITLVATSGYAGYQWIDCDNNNTEISGANSASYTATANGKYAVIINNGKCSDTSACITIDQLKLINEETGTLEIYPNPTQQNVQIQFRNTSETFMIKVYDMVGKLIQKFNVKHKKQFNFNLKGESGIYTIEVQTSSGTTKRTRLTKLK